MVLNVFLVNLAYLVIGFFFRKQYKNCKIMLKNTNNLRLCTDFKKNIGGESPKIPKTWFCKVA
jgi:hypothetical protein